MGRVSRAPSRARAGAEREKYHCFDALPYLSGGIGNPPFHTLRHCSPGLNPGLAPAPPSRRLQAQVVGVMMNKCSQNVLPGMRPCAQEFLKSDLLTSLPVPPDDRLREQAKSIASALEEGTAAGLQPVCAGFLSVAADFYGVERPGIRVLAARPLRVREGGWASELFGDYSPETLQIRVWMRTAVRKQVTSFGTFLSTLCHEFCHHLDYHRFKFRDSWHTRGFYERTAALYHHARGTPAKRLFWVQMPGGRWRIDWPRTQRGR